MRLHDTPIHAICAALLMAASAFAQVDPGPRGGPPGAGLPITGLTTDQTRFFNTAVGQFTEIVGVPSPSPGNGGLGPTFNGNTCAMCHIQPVLGGTSPAVNPQVAVASLLFASNTLPYFVLPNGPVREARFKYYYKDGAVDTDDPDNSVHDLFTIAGRTDAPIACTTAVLPQEDFSKARADNNLALRIPTPLFGTGLIENISDATILDSHKSTRALRDALGIGGTPNRSGNDNTITRFGWKAQNKSLLLFSGEAYNVEVGVTNELMPNERGFGGRPPPVACLGNALPEDATIFVPDTPPPDTSTVLSDIQDFEIFMRFLDQPTPACTGTGCSASIQEGAVHFKRVGCAACHTPSMTTEVSSVATGLSQVQANLFSDLLLHHMGKLADGISQGLAGPDQFRTAPLWGVGQRLFYLHDGRASDLLVAIKAHASDGSEANAVIRNFNGLTATQQQDVLNFLRSL